MSVYENSSAYYADRFDDVDDWNFEDLREALIEDYIDEARGDEEVSVTLTRRDLTQLIYACREAEMRNRVWSHQPDLWTSCEEDHEAYVRASMKECRRLESVVTDLVYSTGTW